MKLNQDKTEILTHPKLPMSSIHFLDGSQVKTTPQTKYLGSLVSWEKPFEIAFYHRLGLAEEAYKKLRLVWNSNKTRSSKVRVFQTVFLPTLLYGLEALTLTPKQLHRIDGHYYRFLRRAIGIKASYYSRITNQSVWEQAGCPELPSERLSYQQYLLTVQVYRCWLAVSMTGFREHRQINRYSDSHFRRHDRRQSSWLRSNPDMRAPCDLLLNSALLTWRHSGGCADRDGFHLQG